MRVLARKISKDGISDEFVIKSLVQFDEFLGRSRGYTYTAYKHRRLTKSTDGTCYAITYVGNTRIITDQQIDDYYRDNFDATYKSKWSKKTLEERQRKHQRLYTVLRKINSEHKYLTQAEGTPEFKELQKLLGA